MSVVFNRITVATAALIVLAASTNVALFAQSSSGQSPDITPTPCGAGVLELCGHELRTSCKWNLVFMGYTVISGIAVPMWVLIKECEIKELTLMYRDRYISSCSSGNSDIQEPVAPDDCI